MEQGSMASEIKVPPLGESVTSATVARWLKQAGEAVAMDEPLVELETDKVTVEVTRRPRACSPRSRPPAPRSRSARSWAGSMALRPGDPPARPACASRRAPPARSRARSGRRRPPQPAPPPASPPLFPPRHELLEENRLRPPPSAPAPARTAGSPRATCSPSSTARLHQPRPLPSRKAPRETEPGEERVRMTRLRRPSRSASRKRRTPPPCSPPSTRWT